MKKISKLFRSKSSVETSSTSLPLKRGLDPKPGSLSGHHANDYRPDPTRPSVDRIRPPGGDGGTGNSNNGKGDSSNSGRHNGRSNGNNGASSNGNHRSSGLNAQPTVRR